MTGLYGHKWTSAYGDECDPDGIWERALTGIDNKSIGLAFSGLVTGGEAWPPSAPEFRKLCEGEKVNDTWQQRAYRKADTKDQNRLPVKRSAETIRKGSELLQAARKGLV